MIYARNMRRKQKMIILIYEENADGSEAVATFDNGL